MCRKVLIGRSNTCTLSGMFEVLADMVRDVEIPLDREALRQLFAIRDRFTARLDVALGEYDAAGLHETDGAVTLQSWLQHETDADPVSASRAARRARLVHASDEVADAAVEGRLSAGQVEVIAANVPARLRPLFAEHAPALVPTLEPLDVARTSIAMAAWRSLADDRPPKEREDTLRLARTLDQRGDVRGDFGPDLMAAVECALRLAMVRDDDRTLAERQAEALGVVCRHFLDHQTGRPGGRHRPHVNVVLRYEDLVAELEAELEATYVGGIVDGMPVAPDELGVLLCDSAVHRLLVAGESGILDYGRATRSIPVDLYNALVLRDHGCRFPGCDRPASWCDGHHLWEWEHGGPTCLENVALFCRRHHRKLHGGWTAELRPDGTLEVTHPDGRVESTEARGPSKRRRRSTGQPERVAA
jgi:hypothetical protein